MGLTQGLATHQNAIRRFIKTLTHIGISIHSSGKSTEVIIFTSGQKDKVFSTPIRKHLLADY